MLPLLPVRFSGSLRISLTYCPADRSYAASIVEMTDDCPFKVELSGIRLAPIWAGRAHPEGAFAYDLAARAALAFAASENEFVYGYAEEDTETMDGFAVYWTAEDAQAALAV